MPRVLSFALAALAGLLAIIVVEHSTGSIEAFRLWYWLAAMPALCIVSAILGYANPHHAWRWGVIPLLAQWLWQLYGEESQIGTGNLGPFAHVVIFAMYVLAAVPCVLAAEIAAYFARKHRADREAAKSA